MNEMMKKFLVGGGHAAAAGLRRETDQPEVLLEQLLAQIESIQSLVMILIGILLIRNDCLSIRW